MWPLGSPEATAALHASALRSRPSEHSIKSLKTAIQLRIAVRLGADFKKERYWRYEGWTIPAGHGLRGFWISHGKVILSDMESNIWPNPPDLLSFKEWKYYRLLIAFISPFPKTAGSRTANGLQPYLHLHITNIAIF